MHTVAGYMATKVGMASNGTGPGAGPVSVSHLRRVATFFILSLALSASTTETSLQHALFRVPIHGSALVFFYDGVTNTSYSRGVFESMRARFAERNLALFELNHDDPGDARVRRPKRGWIWCCAGPRRIVLCR